MAFMLGQHLHLSANQRLAGADTEITARPRDHETFAQGIPPFQRQRRTQFSDAHILVTSDHGNVEDMSTRSHTHHPVPGLVWGPRADTLVAGLARMEDFAAVMLSEVLRDAA